MALGVLMVDQRERISVAAPHGIDPGKVPGGTPELTAEDIAGAMSRLTRFESDLLLYKYAGLGDPASLYAGYMLYLSEKRPDWFGDGRLDDAIRSAIVECVGSNRCPKCKGTEIERDERGNPLPALCSRCNGTGYWYDKPESDAHEKCARLLRMIEQNALDRMA